MSSGRDGEIVSLALDEASYPLKLRELRDPPPVVFVRGRVPELSPSVGIVGSRRASEEGRCLAEQLAREVAEAGMTVISGGALGIDIAAHRGALRADRPTLIVLPTSLDAPHPRAHRRIFEDILLAGGAWLSEQRGPVGRSAFSARNRLIAALADAVVIVEAGFGSGTRHTIRAAIRLGRPIGAVPWAVSDPRGAGSLDVLRRGGRPVASAIDVLRLLGRRTPFTRRAAPRARVDPGRGPGSLESRVLAALTPAGDTPDRIAAVLSTHMADLLPVLTMLEISGEIVARPGGRFARPA